MRVIIYVGDGLDIHSDINKMCKNIWIIVYEGILVYNSVRLKNNNRVSMFYYFFLGIDIIGNYIYFL